MISLNLPMPPSVNELYGAAKNGRRYITVKYRAWRYEAGWAVNLSKQKPIVGQYTICLLIPEKARPDADNCLKATIDLLVRHNLTPDDKCCRKAYVERDLSVPAGRCILVCAEAA